MSDCPGTGIEERIYSLLNPLSKEERIEAIDVLQRIVKKEMFGEIGAGEVSCPKCHPKSINSSAMTITAVRDTAVRSVIPYSQNGATMVY